MKKFFAFLLALGAIAFLVPTEQANGRGYRGRGGRIGGSSRSRRAGGRNKDAAKQELNKIVDEKDLIRDRTYERRNRTS